MNSKLLTGGILAASILVSGCATHPNKISAAYVSPLKFQTYDCQQIALEQSNIERRTNVLYQHLKSRNNSDKWMMGVGLFVAWPALLFVKGNNGAENTEYAQLKGDYEALRTASIQRKCELHFASDLATTVKKGEAKATAPATPKATAPASTPSAIEVQPAESGGQ